MHYFTLCIVQLYYVNNLLLCALDVSMCMCLVCLYTQRVQAASLALYLNFSLSFWICRKSTCRIHCLSAAVRARMCVGGFES